MAKIEAMAFSPKEVKIGKLHSIALSDGEYDAIDHLELTNKRGESVTKPILGVEVDKLRKLNPAILKLWNIRFEKSTNVKLQCKKEVANLDATILRVDPALAVVGGSSKDADEAQPTRPKRKLFQCSYCVRSFSE